MSDHNQVGWALATLANGPVWLKPIPEKKLLSVS